MNEIEHIAYYMYFEGTKRTLEGDYIFDFEDLACQFNVTVDWLEAHFDDIAEILISHQGVLEVWGEEETGEKCFDINFGTAYCGIENEE